MNDQDHRIQNLSSDQLESVSGGTGRKGQFFHTTCTAKLILRLSGGEYFCPACNKVVPFAEVKRE